MENRPGSVPNSPLPPDPGAAASVSTGDTTVVNLGPPPPDGRAPRPPWPLIGLIAGLVLAGLLGSWWISSQRQATVNAAANATAVALATATAESASATQQAL